MEAVGWPTRLTSCGKHRASAVIAEQKHLSQHQHMHPKAIVPYSGRNRMQEAGIGVSILEDSTHEAMVVVSKQALILAFWETIHKRQ